MATAKNKILSLDVGFRSMGWSIWDDRRVPLEWGVITTDSSLKKTKSRVADDYARRAGELAKELYHIIVNNGIKGVVGELPSGGAQNAKAMAQMNMAIAVVSSVTAILELPEDWTTPTEVKKALCTYKSATKEQVKAAVRAKYPRCKFPKAEGTFEHIADSIGAFLACENSNVVKLLLQGSTPLSSEIKKRNFGF